MTAPGQGLTGAALAVAHAFDIEAANAHLAADGGYEIIHESAASRLASTCSSPRSPIIQQPNLDD